MRIAWGCWRVIGDLRSSEADIDIGSSPTHLSQEYEAADVGKPFYRPGSLPPLNLDKETMKDS